MARAVHWFLEMTFLQWQWSSTIIDGLLLLVNKAQRLCYTHQAKSVYYFQVTVIQLLWRSWLNTVVL